jgi:hypothetical protein
MDRIYRHDVMSVAVNHRPSRRVTAEDVHSSLLSDRRGAATYVQTLILVSLVALGCLAAYKAMGSATSESAECLGRSIGALAPVDCEAGDGASASAAPPALPEAPRADRSRSERAAGSDGDGEPAGRKVARPAMGNDFRLPGESEPSLADKVVGRVLEAEANASTPNDADALKRDFEAFKRNKPPRSPLVNGPETIKLLAAILRLRHPYGFPLVPESVIDDVTEGLSKRQFTQREFELLKQLTPQELAKLDALRNDAYERELEFSGQSKNADDGVSDAFRHAYGAAMIAREFGPAWAHAYTSAHEDRGVGNPSAREFMDRHNNRLGISIAAANPDASPEELEQLVADAIRDGKGVHIPNPSETTRENGPLAPTNE